VTAVVYRAGIVGCGRKAATLDGEDRCRINYSIPPDAHAAAYAQIAVVQLVAAADPNEAKRHLMQARWKVPAVYADYREMLARERLDLVSVTTRADRHAEVTIAAAAGVRGVLCEKAMATSLREADAMLDACRRSRTRLIINHTRRWHPTYGRTLDAVRGGAIGDLRCIMGTCPGPLIHNGTHLFDLMRLFGGDVAWISGEVRSRSAQDAPGRAMLRFHTYMETASRYEDHFTEAGFRLLEREDLSERVQPNWELGYRAANHALATISPERVKELTAQILRYGAAGVRRAKEQYYAAVFSKVAADAGLLRYMYFLAERL